MRIFVVADEKYIADTLALILRKSGHEACAFYDAESAVKHAELRSPELVIIDVEMSVMNSVEMAVLIRERHPACEILLFAGKATAVDILEMVRRHGHDFKLLAKPVHPIELLAIIECINYELEAA